MRQVQGRTIPLNLRAKKENIERLVDGDDVLEGMLQGDQSPRHVALLRSLP